MLGDQQSGGPDRVEDKEISTISDNLNKKNSEAEGNSGLNRGNQDDKVSLFRWKKYETGSTRNVERGKWHNNQQTIRQPRGPDNEGNWKANRSRRDEGGNSEDTRSITQGSKSKRNMSSTEPSTSMGTNQAIPYRKTISYRKSHFKPYFNIKTWLNTIQKESEMIIIDVTQHTDDFKTFFSTNLTHKEIISFIDIFSIMCKSKFVSNLASALVFIISTKFIKQVENMVLQLPIVFGAADNFNIDDFFTKLIIFCGKIAELIPSSAKDVLPQVLNAISYTIPNFEKASGESINNETKTAIKSLHGSLEDMVKKKKVVTTKEKRHDYNHDYEDGEAPDNFRNISIYPTAEEITTNKEVFLRHNKVQGNYQNAEHYLDVQFRLMREDFVAPLREGICNYLKQPQDQNHSHTSIKIYKDVRVCRHKLINGIQPSVTIQFMEQARVNKQKMKQSKSFLYGSLLCFSRDNFKTIVFGYVENNDIISDGQLGVGFDEGQKLLKDCAYVMVECKVYFETYKHVLRALQRLDLTKFILRDYFISINDVKDDIKCPNYLRGLTLSSSSEGLNLSQSDAYNAGLTKEVSVIQGPPGTGKTFLGLKLVQTLLENNKMWRSKGPILVVCMTNHALDQFLEGILKFTDSIVRIGGQSKSEALKKYNMKRLKTVETEPLRLSTFISDRYNAVVEQQKELDTLSEKLDLITSYTGVINFNFFKNILQNYKKCWFYRASDETIIKWLLEEFEENFVHQSQSESSMENRMSARKYLEEMQHRIYDASRGFYDRDLSNSIHVKHGERFLIQPYDLKEVIIYFSEKNDKLDPECSEYFKNQYVLDYYRAKYEYILSKLDMLKRSDERYLPQFDYSYDPFLMPIEDRWLFYNHLLHLSKPLIEELITFADETYRLYCDQYNEAKEMLDLNVMFDKMVVGMTTSGAARLQSALKYLQSPIVIVEEAAEVLESHVLTAISSKCEQLILLGDHKQLRPSTADYTIEHDYFLGISLFERYINNGFPFNQLNVQYRMRPEIASLLTPIIYETLDNHPSVYDKPKPPGIINPLYFITHEHRETSTNAATKENRHEATYLLKLAKYLVLNGIEPEKITILAAYTGQLFLLLRERSQYPELYLTVIAVLDNYQGEENDIILLSLVRNNEDGSIGFLAFENRICVALSRAKNGMYIMGNIDLLSARSETWSKIKVRLEEIDSIGTALKLCCTKHPDQITSIENIEDFNQVPDGGCTQLCNDLLECGHNCVLKCHPRDHSDVLCTQQCLKECKFGHQCSGLCHEYCPQCLVPRHCILNCGHEKEIPCSTIPHNKFVRCEVEVLTRFYCGHLSYKKCSTKYNVNLNCLHPCEKRNKGCLSPEDPTHMCKNKCSEVCSPCNIQVKKHRSVCSHAYVVDCSQNIDKLPCTEPCKKSMDCGHECQSKCGHQFGCDCKIVVNKVIPECGHVQKIACILQNKNNNFRRCTENCTKTLPCGHKCKRICGAPCDQLECTELSTTIMSVCGHEIVLPCNVPSNENDTDILSYCEKKCSKTLECGHVCGGTCGECYQGRMHIACAENCNRILVCGHKCLTKCNQLCQPCQSNCTYQCAHIKCKEKCGAPCTLCTKECKRKCRHQSCTKLCHEICDVPPCMEACIEKLNCGHDCMGYCGDPCPPKCHICDKEVEDNPDKKYVLLEDCKHIIKSTDLEKLFTVQNGFIWLSQCPKCGTNIITTQRYHDYIKLAYEDIQEVKKQHHGWPGKIEADRKALLARAKTLALKMSSLGPLEKQICKLFLQILNPTNKNREVICEQFQFIYSSKFVLFEKLILVILKNNGLEQFHATKDIMGNLFGWIYDQSLFITNEEILCFKSELIRFSHAIQLFKIADKIDCNSSEYLECINMLLSIDPYTDESAHACELHLKTLYGTNLIEEIYWEELPKAIDFSKEYWIKCKEGHVFVRDGGGIGCLRCEQPENLELEIGALNIVDFITGEFELIRFCDLDKETLTENSDTENSDVEIL